MSMITSSLILKSGSVPCRKIHNIHSALCTVRVIFAYYSSHIIFKSAVGNTFAQRSEITKLFPLCNLDPVLTLFSRAQSAACHRSSASSILKSNFSNAFRGSLLKAINGCTRTSICNKSCNKSNPSPKNQQRLSTPGPRLVSSTMCVTDSPTSRKHCSRTAPRSSVSTPYA